MGDDHGVVGQFDIGHRDERILAVIRRVRYRRYLTGGREHRIDEERRLINGRKDGSVPYELNTNPRISSHTRFPSGYDRLGLTLKYSNCRGFDRRARSPYELDVLGIELGVDVDTDRIARKLVG